MELMLNLQEDFLSRPYLVLSQGRILGRLCEVEDVRGKEHRIWKGARCREVGGEADVQNLFFESPATRPLLLPFQLEGTTDVVRKVKAYF